MKNFNYLERQEQRDRDYYHDYWKPTGYDTFNANQGIYDGRYGTPGSDDIPARLTRKIKTLQKELEMDMPPKRFKKLSKRLSDIATDYPELMI